MYSFLKSVKDKCSEFSSQHGVLVYDVIFQKEHHGRVLRIYLDGDVTLDVCSRIHSKLSDFLDSQSENFIPYKYSLEVSSLGLDRPLRNKSEFMRYKSKRCKLKVKEKAEDGRLNYSGIIKDVDDEGVLIFLDKEKNSVKILYKNILRANLEIELDI